MVRGATCRMVRCVGRWRCVGSKSHVRILRGVSFRRLWFSLLPLPKIFIAMAKSFARFVLVLSFFIALASCPGRAQQWQFSVQLDPAVNWFFSDSRYLTNAGGQFGFRAGVETSWFFIDRVGLLLGASYDLRKANLLYVDTSLNVTPVYSDPVLMAKGSVLKTSAQYIYIPVGLKMKAVRIGYWTVTSAVGLSMNFRLSHSIESRAMGINKTNAVDFFTWGFPGYFFRLGTEYSLGGRSAVDGGIAYHGTFSAVAKPGLGKLYYHNFTFHLGFIF